MKSERDKNKSGRLTLSMFAVCIVLYTLNILMGKASILLGWNVAHLDDMGEFLLMLLAAMFFIICALQREHAVRVETQEKSR